MAVAPAGTPLTTESFDGLSEELRPQFETLFVNLNPFLNDTATALDRNLSIGDNLLVAQKRVTVTIPPMAWIAPTLLNSWVDHLATANPTGYRIDEFGVVHLRGWLKNGTSAAGTPMFNLPVGYRPEFRYGMATAAQDLFAEVRAQINGDVTFEVGTNVWFSVDNIRFQATNAAAPPTFSGGNWPITLDHGLGVPPTLVLAGTVVDQATNVNMSQSVGQPTWNLNGQNQVVIKRLMGLTPGRTYTINFLIFA